MWQRGEVKKQRIIFHFNFLVWKGSVWFLCELQGCHVIAAALTIIRANDAYSFLFKKA